MSWYDLARGLHVLAVIAWMAGLLFLPRLYAYDVEQNGKPEPLRSEKQGLLRTWHGRLLGIILRPAMGAAWVLGSGCSGCAAETAPTGASPTSRG